MINKYNINNKWGKLKSVALGTTYHPQFYDDVKNKEVKSALVRICEETHEDLNNFESVLKDFGCKVIRPNINVNDNIMNYVNENGEVRIKHGGVPRPPLYPRDDQFVAGNKLFYTTGKPPAQPWQYFDDMLNLYNSKDVIDMRLNYDNVIDAPCYTLVGRDLYIDVKKYPLYEKTVQHLIDNIENVRLNYLGHGGHSDGCFHTLKPGVLMSLREIQTYHDTFPDWDILYLPDQSWNKVTPFTKLKEYTKGKWWVPGEEDNQAFTLFVHTWLEDWLGFVEETVFDVNVLVLDEHHVCVNNMNPDVIQFLKKHKMEAIHVPWRHRYFYDGGLHCLTLDLEREGNQEDYFPSRGDIGITDYDFIKSDKLSQKLLIELKKKFNR